MNGIAPILLLAGAVVVVLMMRRRGTAAGRTAGVPVAGQSTGVLGTVPATVGASLAGIPPAASAAVSAAGRIVNLGVKSAIFVPVETTKIGVSLVKSGAGAVASGVNRVLSVF